MNDNNYILSEMPVGKAMTKIGVPAIFAMLIMAIYNLVDTMFIARLDNTYAMSAISIAFPIMTLIGAVGQILGAGTASAVGRAFGQGKDKLADKLATTAIYLALISGVLFAFTGLTFLEPIFKVFGATDSVMEYAKAYGSWMFVGAIFSIPNQAFNNLARAETRATLSMLALTIGAVSNIILDPIFMFDLNGFGLNLGIEGASIATTIAQSISFLFIGSFFFFNKMRVSIKPKNFAPIKKVVSDILRSGVPIGVVQVLSTVAITVVNNICIMVAIDELTGVNMQSASGIVLKIILIFQYIVMGFLQGFQPIASYSYGSRDKHRFFTAFRYSVNFIIGYSMIVSTISIFFAPQIISIMSPSSPQVLEMSETLLRNNSVFFLFLALIFLLIITFQSTGNGRQGGILAFSRQGFIFIPAIIILTSVIGLDGIYYAQPLSDLITAFIALSLYMNFKKTLDEHFNK